MKRTLLALTAAMLTLSLLSFPAAAAVSSSQESSSSKSGSSEESTDASSSEESEDASSSEESEDASSSGEPASDEEQPSQGVQPELSTPPGTENPDSRPGSGTLGVMAGLQTRPESAIIASENMENPVYARVSTITADEALAGGVFPGEPQTSLVFEAALLSGDFEGTTVSAVQRLDEIGAKHMRLVKPGDEVYLTLYRDEAGAVRGVFSDFRRVAVLYVVAVIAALLLMFLCRRWAGIKMAASFAVALLVLLLVYLPMQKAGQSAILAGALSCALVVILAVWIMYGVKYRTIAAAIGALLSLGVSGLLVVLTEKMLRLSGVSSLERLRNFYTETMPESFSGQLVVGVMFSALGAVIILSNTVSAGADPKLSGERFGRVTSATVFRTGFSRGCSALSPIVTTLVFAAGGYMLGTLTLLSLGGMPLGRVLSDELVVTELLRMFAGVLGLLTCIPFTALICSFMLPIRLMSNGELHEFHVKESLVKKQQAYFASIAHRLEGTSKNAVKVSINGSQSEEKSEPALTGTVQRPEERNTPEN